MCIRDRYDDLTTLKEKELARMIPLEHIDRLLTASAENHMVYTILTLMYRAGPVSYTHLHPVAGTYKKECIEQGKKYFSVASGGGTGRTLHPDNMAAGPASYGMTDTLGRMHSDAQFAGSSSVPAHVEMMGLIGAGNNPMVGMTAVSYTHLAQICLLLLLTDRS